MAAEAPGDVDMFVSFYYSLSTMDQLTREVKRMARQVGFDVVGVARPTPSLHMRHYRSWLEHGYHGEMGYLSRAGAVEKRSEPRALVPEAECVVVVGMNYYPGDFPPPGPLHGRVSRYAWGVDYHDVMLEKLKQLASRIRRRTHREIEHRAYVDFGPVMERELALRAGLGWIGKNTNVIHPRLGSYLFLGELFLGLELVPDTTEVADHCGNCTACLEACPTGALVRPHVLDARRCISYLTIEHRGAIPDELRSCIGDWVFGCDVCQEVCPWNRRFARLRSRSALAPEHPLLNLLELLGMDEAQFRNRFRDTPLWRPRRAGLLRNAAVVLGNVGDCTAIPILDRACLDQSDLVRRHAAWARARVPRG